LNESIYDHSDHIICTCRISLSVEQIDVRVSKYVSRTVTVRNIRQMRVQGFNKIIHMLRNRGEGGWVGGSVYVANKNVFVMVLNFKYYVFKGL